MFVFELRDAESLDSAGSFITSVPGPWDVGDTFMTSDGRWLRIVERLVDDPPADPRCAGVWLVEACR
jgi:hypothetical protein